MLSTIVIDYCVSLSEIKSKYAKILIYFIEDKLYFVK